MIELQYISIISAIERYYRQQGYTVERLNQPYKIMIKKYKHNKVFRQTSEVIALDLSKTMDNKIVMYIKYRHKEYKIRIDLPTIFILEDYATRVAEVVSVEEGTPIEIGIAKAIDTIKNK